MLIPFVVLAAALAQTAKSPRVLEVPAGFASIQSAIDSARHGDTVLVAPGRYYENVRFKGRNVVVTSHFARTRDLRDIEATVIDGSRPTHPDTATVVRFVNQEDSTAVIQGFSITGGKGTVWLDAKDHHHFREGGGILCELSSPTIRFNYIQDNEAVAAGPGVVSAGGGGIRCGYAEPTITNNVIRRNRGRYGAGVVIFHSAAVIRNNLIAGNVGGEDYGGAGLWVVFALSRRLATVVEHNTIVANRSTDGASLQQGPMRGVAGGVWTNGVSVVFDRNIVWGNRQSRGAQVAFTPANLQLGRNLVEDGLEGRDPALTVVVDPRFADSTGFELLPSSPAREGPIDRLGAYSGPRASRLIPPPGASSRRPSDR